jgi:putative intracellular protease/amidase
MKVKKILFVVTSHGELGKTGKKNGQWIEEFAAPYYKFLDLGKEIVVASPKGGKRRLIRKMTRPNIKRKPLSGYNDAATQVILSNAALLSIVSESDFNAIFYPGGHGPMWDLRDNPDSIKLIAAFYNNGKPVTQGCRASVALKNVTMPDGQWLVKGKRISAFTNSEEEAAQLTHVVPFLLQNMLIERGAGFQQGEDRLPSVTRDGLLITGQNSASSILAADTLSDYAERL